MRIPKWLPLFILLITGYSCEKTSTDLKHPSSLISEVHLSLKSVPIYTDESGNTYLTLNFSPDTLSHTYSIFFEQNRIYYLNLSGEDLEPIGFWLLTPEKDTLFFGERMDRFLYIYWQSVCTDTFYVCTSYNEALGLKTEDYHLTFEELTILDLEWEDLQLEYSGDWFINANNYLTLACHNTGQTKWVRINDNSLFNYDFSTEVGLRSGMPDIYTGIAFFSTDNLWPALNHPMGCYEFKILAPDDWERRTWFSDGGYGVSYGKAGNINTGADSWNELGLSTSYDSVTLSVNEEEVHRFRNTYFMDNGLYITVDDLKEDTVYFRNFSLNKQ